MIGYKKRMIYFDFGWNNADHKSSQNHILLPRISKGLKAVLYWLGLGLKPCGFGCCGYVCMLGLKTGGYEVLKLGLGG